jgi:CHAD domain-containing protein
MSVAMPSQTVELYRAFGAQSLLDRVQELTLHIPGVREAKDIEFVHQMRVASRRLRAAMSLFEDTLDLKPYKKAIKRVTGDLGAARDLDVQILFLERYLERLGDAVFAPGIRRIQLRLRQQREDVQTAVVKALDRLQKSAALPNLSQAMRELLADSRVNTPQPDFMELRTVAARNICLRLEELLSFEPCVKNAESVDQHHQMRIAAKKLRYTMEIFASIFPPGFSDFTGVVKEAQKILGEIHDSDVWVLMLPAFIAEETERAKEYFGNTRPMGKLVKGMNYLCAEQAKNRARQHDKFVKFWEEATASQTWRNLRLLLRAEPASASSSFSSTLAAEQAAPLPE